MRWSPKLSVTRSSFASLRMIRSFKALHRVTLPIRRILRVPRIHPTRLPTQEPLTTMLSSTISACSLNQSWSPSHNTDHQTGCAGGAERERQRVRTPGA
ncbi:MAG: hypothetical protein [Cressdnaviricota sp.]|nr:MAG: hypothetical protein [Cressdnaviricota sp.]